MEKPSKEMKNVSISFNLANPDERDMYEFAKQRNFSSYVKRLIWADMVRREEVKEVKKEEPEEKKEDDFFSANDFI